MCYLLVHLYAIIIFFFFFFNDTATTEIYTLSLHDALPISGCAHTLKLIRRPPASWDASALVEERYQLRVWHTSQQKHNSWRPGAGYNPMNFLCWPALACHPDQTPADCPNRRI